MRFSDIVLLLLITLVAFGFLLSHSINLNEQLTQTRVQLAETQAAMQELNNKYQIIAWEKAHLTEQVSGLRIDNVNLQARVETLEAERLTLTAQMEELQSKLALIEAATPTLVWLVSNPMGLALAWIVIPIVPISLGTVFVMTHKKPTNATASHGNGKRGSQTTIQAVLTRDEFHLVAMRRKSQAARR